MCFYVLVCFFPENFLGKTQLAKSKPLHEQTPFDAPRALPLVMRDVGHGDFNADFMARQRTLLCHSEVKPMPRAFQ